VAEAIEEIADRLYTAPPDAFVAARDEAVAAAREAGDTATARELAKLRRPTIAAWLVNILAIRRPDLIEELAELATALRTAQRELRGAELRELSARRRAAVATLVTRARDLALEAEPGTDPARLPLAEVESTFTAALSDADVAAQLGAGRLVRAVAYAGFGEVPRPQLRLVTGGAAPARRTAGPVQAAGRTATEAGDEAAAEEPAVDMVALRRELNAARTGQKRAEADLEKATAAEHDGARLLADIEREIAELDRRRSAAEEELTRRKMARKTAERAAIAARRRVGDAQGAIEAIEHDRSPGTGRADRKRVGQAQSGG
jgi:chromosome segregation ATPase